MAHEVIGYATSPDAITMTAPASPKCVAIECFKQWNFLFAIGSPGCALYVLTTLSAGHGENLSGIYKKFLRVRSRGFYSLFSRLIFLVLHHLYTLTRAANPLY